MKNPDFITVKASASLHQDRVCMEMHELNSGDTLNTPQKVIRLMYKVVLVQHH